MIELFKLIRLPPTQKIRKVIKILEILEAECVTSSADVPYSAVPLSCDSFYIKGLCTHLASIYPADTAITAAVESYRVALHAGVLTAGDYRVLFNTLRHALYRQSGVQPSEWDLIAPGQRYGTGTPKHDTTAPNPNTAIPTPDAAVRPFYPGVYVYAEDIRSPFNLGSIFRTAEAFGAEKLFLSPFCTDPSHPRAVRSAMGCIDFLPSKRISLDELCVSMPDLPVFALETGGTPLSQFKFPRRGIVVIGSEELGINPDTLKKMSHGIVSIPVSGVKASLNVGVAFGILMQAWTAAVFN